MRTAQSVFLPLAFGLCALSPAAFADHNSQNNDHDRGQDITGSWHILVTIPARGVGCPGLTDCKIPAFATATSDGTVVQTAVLPNVSNGHGLWQRTRLRQFTVRSSYFRFDPTDNNALLSTSVTVTNVTIDKSGPTGTLRYAMEQSPPQTRTE
jgi:hypothetical protein